MPEPLTKEDRESIHRYALGMIAHARDQQEHDDALVLLQYEATVAALESQLAELRPLAEVGRAVAGMAVGDELRRGNEMAWTLTRHNDVHRHGFTALAALRAAKGEGDE